MKSYKVVGPQNYNRIIKIQQVCLMLRNKTTPSPNPLNTHNVTKYTVLVTQIAAFEVKG